MAVMKRFALAIMAGLIFTGCGQSPSQQAQVSTSAVAEAAAADSAVYQTYNCAREVGASLCIPDSIYVNCQLNLNKNGNVIASTCRATTATDPINLLGAALDPSGQYIVIKTRCASGEYDMETYFTYAQDCIQLPSPVI